MPKLRNREEFKDYCMRKLGWPALKVNVTDDQIEDRVDEALSFWKDYHYDGSEFIYMKHEMTQEDIDRGYILVPESVIGIVRILDIAGVYSSGGMFSAEYQFMLNNVRDIAATGGLPDYMVMRQHVESLSEWLTGYPQIRFNRISNKLYIDVSKSKIPVGRYIIMEAYVGLEEFENSDVWNDRWLQNYATTLIQELWGQNISKFQNPQLVGGVMFNGDKILDDTKKKKKKMEQEVLEGFSSTLTYFLG